MDRTKIIYVCTVGTGTAGKASDVSQGIIAAVKLKKPVLCVLIPSAEPRSTAVAEIVCEGIQETCPSEIHRVSDHDEMLKCRTEMRAIFNSLAARNAGALVINPTSGTKQMTAAAILAAIDMEIGEIEFITGERQDGVVKTGSERIRHFSGREILAGYTLRDALLLMKSGAYDGAVKILEKYSDIFPTSWSMVNVLYNWDRFGYERALGAAKGEQFAGMRKVLSRLISSSKISDIRAADILNYAKRCLENGQIEEALSVLYRVIELFAKLKLEEFCVGENATIEDIKDSFNIGSRLEESLMKQYQKRRSLDLGLAQAFEIINCHHEARFSFINNIFNNKEMWETVQMRQETRYGHGARCIVREEKVKELYDAVYASAIAEWPKFKGLFDESKFPDIESIIKEELNNI